MYSRLAPPEFSSSGEFSDRRADAGFWFPYITEILRRHDLEDGAAEPVAGHNSTFPTFVFEHAVVKLFGWAPATWATTFSTELAALELAGSSSQVDAPRLLGAGRLFEHDEAPWPYLVLDPVPGEASWRVNLTEHQRRDLARAVGRQIRALHALPPTGRVSTERDWPVGNVTAAARRSSLPAHLIAQIDSFLGRLGTQDPVFVNSDVVANHVYVSSGSLSGIIDWGDAMVTDRHVEIIQIYRDLLECDTGLLSVFLDASDWPVTPDFPYLALAHALRRQSIGLLQHGGIDVFEPIAEKYPLPEIETLDELARELFTV